MRLFKPDLYRNFGIGFGIGALLVGASLAPHFEADLATPAKAATADTQDEGVYAPTP